MFKITTRQYYFRTDISPVEVEKFNDKSIWIDNKRIARYSSWDNYYESWESAYRALIEAAKQRVENSKAALHRDRSILGQIESLKKPD